MYRCINSFHKGGGGQTNYQENNWISKKSISNTYANNLLDLREYNRRRNEDGGGVQYSTVFGGFIVLYFTAVQWLYLCTKI
jgi:hypothetical protein